MEFEWDSAKSDRCYAERGFDFAYAARAFADPQRDVFVDDRWEYSETRFILRGRVDGRLLVIVFTYRGMRARIISARKANTREVADHERRSRNS
ncbi:MAG: BrnT family toxin [Spirochaetaceae bacterium]|nr:MAG: BrnT family toxin [Spirochaetaceae bacterium]